MNCEKVGPIAWRNLVGRSQVLLVAGALGLAIACPAWADEFEPLGNWSASTILPAKMITGPHYTIKDKVVSYGYMNHWAVRSDFGPFEVTGDGALRNLLKEIKAITALREISRGEAYLRAVGHAAKAPFELGKKLIDHPVDTVSGIPKGLFSIFENVSKSITMEHDPTEDSKLKQALFVSSWKRDFAHEHGVDVYSTNKVLQKELNRIGWAAAIGGLSVSAVGMASSATAVAVASNMRLANQLNDVLKEEPPSRLRIINTEKLKGMKIREDLIEKFVEHPHFSPRHTTVIIHNLDELKSASGRNVFIEYVLSAKDKVGANFFMHIAETMRGYQEMVAPITEIKRVGIFIVAKAQNGTALVPFPLDYGRWTKRAKGWLAYLKSNYKSAGWNGQLDLWVTGQLSPTALKNISAMGYKITQNVDQKIGTMD